MSSGISIMAAHMTGCAREVLIGCSALAALPVACKSLHFCLRHLLIGRGHCAAATCRSHSNRLNDKKLHTNWIVLQDCVDADGSRVV